MATQTTNLHQVKPTYTERADIAIINQNMNILDEAVGANAMGKIDKPVGEPSGKFLKTGPNNTLVWGDAVDQEDVAEQVESVVETWLGENMSGTTGVDKSLSTTGAAADAKVTGDNMLEVREEIASLADDAYVYDDMTAADTVSSYRLNELDGLCTSNASYKLIKYAVTAGDVIKVISDDRFQFQNSATVPTSGTSNRVGVTYIRPGSYVLKVPTGATHVILSTPTVSTAAVKSATSIHEDIEALIKVQDTEPTEDGNKQWVMETPESEVQVPTYAEFQDLSGALTNYVDLIMEKYTVDFSRFSPERAIINSNGNWTTTSGSNYSASCIVPILTGVESITLKANNTISCSYSILKSIPESYSGAADFAVGYTGTVLVNQSEETTIKVPSDGKYMYISRASINGTDRTPTVEMTGSVVTTSSLIPRGNIVPNRTRSFSNEYYYANSVGVNLSSGTNSSYGTVIIPVEPSTHYTCNKLRYLTQVGDDMKSLAISEQNITGFDTLETAKYIYATYYTADNTVDNLIISSGNSLDSFTGKYEIPWLYDTNRKVIDNISSRVFGIEKPFQYYSGNDQTYTFDNPNSIKRNKFIAFTCDVESLGTGEIEVGLVGASGGNVISLVIGATSYKVKKSGTAGSSVSHGLTISDKLSVTMLQTVDKIKYTISSNGIIYSHETNNTNAYSKPSFAATGVTISNVYLSWTCRDFWNDIWMFGDSYFSYGDNRWMYYLIENGYSGNCLIDAYAGEGSERAVASLKSYIGLAKPKFIVWCLGMNDGSDSSSTLNSTWKNGVNEVLSICNTYGIIPIFGTIPTVPNINHEQKNAWIRASGYQYIDFAKAVGAQSNGTWFTGMLHTDNVHPTQTGAIALYYQAITDCPQFLQMR